MMTVEESAQGFCVKDGKRILRDGFKTHSAAWEWLDRNERDDGDFEDRYRRIQKAFSEQ